MQNHLFSFVLKKIASKNIPKEILLFIFLFFFNLSVCASHIFTKGQYYIAFCSLNHKVLFPSVTSNHPAAMLYNCLQNAKVCLTLNDLRWDMDVN